LVKLDTFKKLFLKYPYKDLQASAARDFLANAIIIDL
jgi:hypothetical protein